ncbi:hypothetical protein ACM9HF_02345 [Colwellia sp. RE-S-Sl-9]
MTNKVSFKKNGERCTVTLSNSSKTDECTTTYEISVFDSDDDRWEDHAKTTSTLKPKTVLSKEYHKYGATDWDYTIVDNYCE